MKLIDDDEKEISEINMTPFVDIVLVILIIFMATANFIIERKIPLNLPEAQNSEKKETKEKDITITITKEKILFNSKPIKLNQLKDKLKSFSKDTTIVLRADKDIKFQKVVDVIDICKGLGLEKFIVETKGKY